MRSFFTNMILTFNEMKANNIREAKPPYDRVKAFVLSGSYSKYKGIKELAYIYVNGGNDKTVADKLGISEVTARVHKRNASMELYQLLGNDFFELLLAYNANKEEVDRRIALLEYKDVSVENILPFEVYNLVKGEYHPTKVGYKLKDCMPEINFIREHSISSIQTEITLLDTNKLRYILAMIVGEVGSAGDRYKLLHDELLG